MSSAKHTEAAGAAVKIESTYNTDPTVAVTDAIRIIKPRPLLKPEFLYDGARGIANGGFGRHVRQTPTGRFVKNTLRVEPKGRGAAYTSSAVEVPDVHRLLRAAGFDAAVTTTGGSEKWDFTPTSGTGTPASVSSWLWGEGEVWKVNGMYTDLKITSDGPGIPGWEFPFAGTMVTDPADTALPSLTYTVPTVVPPTATNVAFTLGNLTAGVVKSFTFALNRGYDQARTNLNTSLAHAGFQPGPRDPVLECVVEATSLQGSPFTATSAYDPWSLVENATSGLAFSLVVGGTQYNRWKLIFTQCQVSDAEPVEGEGSAALRKLTIRPYVVGDQDNSDITIRFD